MVQEWFVTGAQYGFIGFFTTFIFIVLWVFVLGVIGIIAGFAKGGDDDEP